MGRHGGVIDSDFGSAGGISITIGVEKEKTGFSLIRAGEYSWLLVMVIERLGSGFLKVMDRDF